MRLATRDSPTRDFPKLRRRGRVVLVVEDPFARIARHDLAGKPNRLVEGGAKANVTRRTRAGDGADDRMPALALAEPVELRQLLRREALLDFRDLRLRGFDLGV